ncbi:MAG: S1 RNA-binding domain-containing protein [Myxococcales bacterium]|nr:S1 RNA-binding domain-containing protein [Myxococcales bacterium]
MSTDQSTDQSTDESTEAAAQGGDANVSAGADPAASDGVSGPQNSANARASDASVADKSGADVASDAHDSGDSDDAGDSADTGDSDDASEPGEPGEGGAAEGAAAAGTDPAKRKRRRRRRKKKPGDATVGAPPGEAPDAAEGAAAQAVAADDAVAPSADGSSPTTGAKAAGPKPRADGAAKREPRAARGNRDSKRHAGPPMERPAFNVGDEVFGRVTNVTPDAIWLDVAGGKATAFHDRAELHQIPPKPGELFIAKVKSLSTRGGALMLGPEPWDLTQTKNELRAALESNNPIDCWVTGLVRGGIEVDYKGIRAFAPSSHVALSHQPDLAALLGEKLSFIVTQYAKGGRDVVLSRKDMLVKEHTERRNEQLSGLTPDAIAKAVVRGVVAWGAFVTLPEHGDIEGVIHMSEVSHDRGARVSSVLSVDMEIDVKVLRIDESGKLWLSHRATIENPWGTVAKKYALGSIHRGKVVRLTDFGAFVQLEPSVDALCHVADLGFEPVEHPSKVLNEGDELDFLIAAVDAHSQKIALHPAPPESERELPRARIVPNQIVKVEVKQIKEAGLGVRILGATGRGSRGFVPAGQTGTQRGADLRKTFPPGTKLDAKVLEVDPRRGEARLSLRAVKDDEEKRSYRDYQKKVQSEASFGTFGDLFKKLER